MLITLYGPDSYRRLKNLNIIVESYREKYTGFSYERLNLVEMGALDKLKNFVKTQSIFDSVRLVVLDNILEEKEQMELRELMKANAKTKDITIVVNSAKKPPVPYKFLFEKGIKNEEYPALKDEKLKAFISQTAASHKLKLDAQKIKSLASIFGSDTWGLATELEQMALSTNHISKKKPNADYFGLINAVKYGKSVKERLIALEIILSDRKDDPARVFNSLAYRLGSESEARLYADYDVAVKSGKLEYEEVLLGLALGART